MRAGQAENLRPLLLRRLGVYLTGLGRIPQAVAMYEKALAARVGAKPDAADVILWTEQGRLYHLAEQYAKAAEQFSRVLAALGHPDKFGLDEEIRKAILAEPGPTYQLFGECYLLSGRLPEAAAAFQKSQALAPNKALWKYNQARLAARAPAGSAKPEQALADLEESFRKRLAGQGLGPYELLAELLRKLGREEGTARAAGEAARRRAAECAAGLLPRRPLPPGRPIRQGRTALRPVAEECPHCDRLPQPGRRSTARPSEPMPSWNSSATASRRAVRPRSSDPRPKPSARTLRCCGPCWTPHGRGSKHSPKSPATAGAWPGPAPAGQQAVRASRRVVRVGAGGRAEAGRRNALDLGRRPAPGRTGCRGRQGASSGASTTRPCRRTTQPFTSTWPALALSDRTDEALAAARKAAELKKSVRMASRVPWILYHAKRYPEATRAYEELVAKFDDDHESAETREVLLEARLALSNLCVLGHDLPAAEEWLEQALDEFPDDVSASNDLGYLWADQDKHLHRALAMVQKAVAAEPDNTAYRDSLGWALFRLGRYQEAVVELEKAAADKKPDAADLRPPRRRLPRAAAERPGHGRLAAGRRAVPQRERRREDKGN